MVGAGTPLVTDAVVLRLVPYAEADLVVTLFTRAQGKVSAMARGARKSRRRFGAALTLFVEGEATLRERRTVELLALERFDARRDFTRLAADVVMLAHGSYATELVRELTASRQPDPAVLDLLLSLYQVTAEVGPRADTLRAFELRLLGELGLRPVLDRCLGCGADAAGLERPGTIIDPGQGGALCPVCAPHARSAGIRPLPPGARVRLVELQKMDLAAAAALPPVGSQDLAAARAALHALIAAHLRAPLRSLEFIAQLRG